MKKIIATILALCMILGLAGVANAEATTLTMWTFIAQHQEFYESMAKLWNEQNPEPADRPAGDHHRLRRYA